MGDLSDLMATILAANIKTLRAREGPTQVEFAEKLNVSQGTVARWEKGAKPEVEHIVKMARMAGVSVQDFTGQLVGAERGQITDLPPGVLFLQVQLPSEAALTDMFEALLETMPAESDRRTISRKLAELLPGALARTVSHSRAEIAPEDQPQPPRASGEDQSVSDRTLTR